MILTDYIKSFTKYKTFGELITGEEFVIDNILYFKDTNIAIPGGNRFNSRIRDERQFESNQIYKWFDNNQQVKVRN